MDQAPLVSVIVAARNAAGGIGGLLDALARQTLGRARFEAIVVDDASKDETAALVEAHGVARVVARDACGGSYAARNSGLAVARAPVIATTDADCLPRTDWLERGLEELEARGADLLGGRIDIPLGDRPRLAEVLDAARFLNQERAVSDLGFAATANLFVRRHVFEAAGPFDARFRSGGDAEFCDRATRAGFSLAYSPLAVVVHPPRTRGHEIARKSFRVGFGVAQMRQLASGPARDAPPAWRTPRAYARRPWLHGGDRLARAGYRLSPGRRAALELAQYGLVQLPMIAGQLAADMRSARE